LLAFRTNFLISQRNWEKFLDIFCHVVHPYFLGNQETRIRSLIPNSEAGDRTTFSKFLAASFAAMRGIHMENAKTYAVGDYMTREQGF
jgi:hypothetical protein